MKMVKCRRQVTLALFLSVVVFVDVVVVDLTQLSLLVCRTVTYCRATLGFTSTLCRALFTSRPFTRTTREATTALHSTMSEPHRRPISCEFTVSVLHTHTHTDTHPFNGPLCRTTRVSRYQKGKQRQSTEGNQLINQYSLIMACCLKCTSAPSGEYSGMICVQRK